MKKEHLIEGRLAKEGERQLSSYFSNVNFY